MSARSYVMRAKAALGLLWLVAGAAVEAAPPPAEHFTRDATFRGALLSPSGRHVAVVVTADTGRQVAAVIDLDNKDARTVVAAFGDANVKALAWVNDKRLVFTAQQDGDGDLDLEGFGTFAVNADGSESRQLTAWRTSNVTTGSRFKDRTLNWQ